MQTKENIDKIFDYLNELYPNPKCELQYKTPFQLLIAVILSAQCTDKRVNEITPLLFEKYPTAIKLANASIEDVENIIRPLGFFRNKAKSIVNCSKQLIEKYSDPQATHNCVAYIIGTHERAYDDGEPSGTAGMPMLNVLKMQGLTNIIAIVTRHFGGIKLGAGGLTRAYSQSVAQALKEAKIVEKEPVDLYAITIDYTYTRKFEHLLKVQHIQCIDIQYLEQVCYQCYIRDLDFLKQIQELTNNQFEAHKIGTDYIKKDV